MWRVELLGNLRVAWGESVVTRFESRRVAALLARVALAPERLHPREELAALLWPDADRAVGLERLRHVLSSLQRQATLLGETVTAPLLIVDRQNVRINAQAVTCDAVEFERYVRQRTYERARDLYAGDLMPGFYDDWVLDEQARFRALFESLPAAGSKEILVNEATAQPIKARPAAARAFSPGYLTTFFGREDERKQLQELLEHRRLITLTGPFGCGKTRLAVEVARDSEKHFEQVVFVPLAECVAPEQIPDRLRSALALPAVDTPVLEQLEVALGNVRLLLVLDNIEHLVGLGVPEIVESLLARLPLAHCLATSRSLLGVPGEQAFPLAPLPFPEASVSLADAPHSASIALFVDRARAARPDFVVTERNVRDLAALCQLLEGIPLALELAAARIRAHSLAEMCRQMQDEEQRFILTASHGVRAQKTSRHASLQAAIAWSWRLLAPRQQEFMASLSVLRGLWTAEVAASVCDEPNAAYLLEELANHSLIQMQSGGENEAGDQQARFTMLESIRVFAARLLSPAQCHDLHRRYSAYVLRAIEKSETGQVPMGAEQLPVWEAALENALADNAADEALSLCAAFDDVWLRIGRSEAALALVSRAVALPEGTPARRAEALEVGSFLAISSADLPLAAEWAELAGKNAGDDAGAQAAAFLAQGRVAYVRMDPFAQSAGFLNAAIGKARQTGNVGVEASALSLRGMAASREHDFNAAERDIDAALALWKAAARPVRVNQMMLNRAVIASDQGHYAEAIQRFQACLVEAQRTGDVKLEVLLQHNIGVTYARQEQWQQALGPLYESVIGSHALGHSYSLAYALWNIAEPMVYLGQEMRAIKLLAFARHFWTQCYGALSPDEEGYCARIAEQAQNALDEAMLKSLQAEGESLTLQRAVQIACENV